MTSKQTPAALKDGYGFGFTVGAREFGHGGALYTETAIDTSSGLITIFLIQQAGFIGDGAKLRTEFKRVAREKFGGGASGAPEATTLAERMKDSVPSLLAGWAWNPRESEP